MSDDTVLSHSFDNLDSNAYPASHSLRVSLGMRSRGWRYMFRLSHTIRFVTIGHREGTFRYEHTLWTRNVERIRAFRNAFL
jgi:hypothetical protein